MADSVAATFAAMAAMFAIYRRDQGGAGIGQEIDVSLYEPLFRLAEAQVIGFDQLGIVKRRQGNRLAEDSPRNTYETADGHWIAISASSQRTFERLCEAMGMTELIGDPRYATNALRCEHADALDTAMAAWFRARRCDDVMRLFDAAHVVAGPVLTIADIVHDPHYAARGDIVSVPDDDFGKVRMQGVVPRFLTTPGEVRHAGRGLGADNRAVYIEHLGVEETEFARLVESGVI
jgi:crotonobetainyl-CoA:carnitine CoA-transferase CaiB-like acyl-CoA transferase